MSRRQPQQPPPGSRGSSLVTASLDIGRVLVDHGGVIRARGTCMYPTVRPGDVLHIHSCAAADVTVGDIAVCRGPDCLFAHRVVDTARRDGRAYVITRSDRSAHDNDAPTFDDNLLGVVVSVERDGVAVPLQPTPHSRAARSYLSVRLALVEAGPPTRLWRLRLVSAVARVQDLPPYRSVSRRWFARARSTTGFTVRVPVNPALGDAVVRELELGAFDPTAPWNGRRVEWWTLAAFVKDAKEAAGSITCARDPEGAWQLEKPSVRIRYRGTGLEDMLVREAKTILERDGGSTQEAGR